MSKYRLISRLSVVALLALLGLAPAFARAGDGPVLSITPGSFAFGPINVGGELGEPGEFTLKNTGSESVTLDEANLTGSDVGSFKILPNGSSCYWIEPVATLLPGASCTVVTIFDPESEGPKQANLEIISSSSTSPDSMPLSGTGLAELLPGASVTPQTLAFGERQADTSSPARTITLSSTGTGDLTIGGLILSGTDSDQFTVTGNSCSNRSMATGDSCEVQVVFNPTGTGPRSTTLTIPTDDDGADTTVDLTGTGTGLPGQRHSSRIRIGGRLPRLGTLRRLALPVRCSTFNMDHCRGRVRIKVRGRALGLPHNRLVQIGARQYSMRAGRRTVRVRIGNRSLRQVRRRGSLLVQVTVTSRQGDGNFRTVSAGRRIRR